MSSAEERASGYSLLQEQVLAISPKISASISIPCSCFIIAEVIGEHKAGRGTTAVQRTLLAMSCVDIAASFAWFLSSWAVPAESDFAFAAGTVTTCTMQGFLLQFAIGAPLYNSSLSLLYLLMIKMRWTDQQLARVEKWIHVCVGAWTLGTSTLLLPLKQYNHIGAVCWVIGSPGGCGNSSFQANPEVECDRGDYAWAWGLALFYVPLWLCVMACSVSMALLYSEVRTTHQRSIRYSNAIVGLQSSARRHTKRLAHSSSQDTNRVAIQAILYSLSFVITWLPSTLWSIAHWFHWSHYGLDIAAAIAEPLQGLWNFLIFLKSRPRTVAKIRNSVQRSASRLGLFVGLSSTTTSSRWSIFSMRPNDRDESSTTTGVARNNAVERNDEHGNAELLDTQHTAACMSSSFRAAEDGSECSGIRMNGDVADDMPRDLFSEDHHDDETVEEKSTAQNFDEMIVQLSQRHLKLEASFRHSVARQQARQQIIKEFAMTTSIEEEGSDDDDDDDDDANGGSSAADDDHDDHTTDHSLRVIEENHAAVDNHDDKLDASGQESIQPLAMGEAAPERIPSAKEEVPPPLEKKHVDVHRTWVRVENSRGEKQSNDDFTV
ncbi:expressed unknown protein [Seminavis robusta]|uniref:G-protein coupled receptors family 2 profile 2 domain-containing protein n=1 Tax=Seminavis robusta TaxID=568900 RepID=A0A9N8DWS4_9STRA|nr:expressed unknown protein [Seminavis robusta]|eukprot:Sro410_g137470.1 n/a (605) ;mRNA; r:55101-57058